MFFLAKTLLPPQTPRLGARESLNLTVDPQYADGEIGFEKTSVTVTEPDGVQPKEVKINVLRDGTLYKANLLWSIVDVKASTDVSPIDGSIAFENGKCRSSVCMVKCNLDYSVIICHGGEYCFSRNLIDCSILEYDAIISLWANKKRSIKL